MGYFTRIYNVINEEFENPDLAMMVVQIHTINLTTKIKPNKLIEKSKIVLWHYPIDDIELAISLSKCIHSWETRQTMHGINGCEKKTFKELLELQL